MLTEGMKKTKINANYTLGSEGVTFQLKMLDTLTHCLANFRMDGNRNNEKGAGDMKQKSMKVKQK